MHKSTLFEYLGTFKKAEWKSFKKYLSSSIGDQTDTYRLFRLIEKHATDLHHKDLNLEIIGKKSFQGATRKTLLNYMSKLSKEIEHYWTLEEFEEEKRAYDLFKLKALNRRGLYDKADKLGSKIRKNTLDPKRYDIWDHYYLLAADHELYFSYNPIKSGDFGKKLLEECISSALAFSNEVTHYHKIEGLNRISWRNEPEWTPKLKRLSSIHKGFEESSKTVLLNRIYNFIKDDDEADFEFLMELFFSENIKLSEPLSVSLFVFLRKYFAKKISNGNMDYNKRVADFLFQAQVENRTSYRGVLPVETFRASIAALCNVGQTERALELINDAEGKLSKEISDQAIILAKLTLYTKNEQYIEAISLHQKNEFNTFYYKSNALPIMLRIYYQTLEADTSFIQYQLRNFRDYILRHRSDFSIQRYSGLKNFLKILGLMISNEDLEIIEKQISNFDQIFYRTWIMEQLNKEDL